MAIDLGKFSVDVGDKEPFLLHNIAMLKQPQYRPEWHAMTIARIPREYAAEGFMDLGEQTENSRRETTRLLKEAPFTGRTAMLFLRKLDCRKAVTIIVFEHDEDMLYWKLRYT